jgi:hypothetical protein
VVGDRLGGPLPDGADGDPCDRKTGERFLTPFGMTTYGVGAVGVGSEFARWRAAVENRMDDSWPAAQLRGAICVDTEIARQN